MKVPSVYFLSIILLSLAMSCKNSQKASQKSYVGLTAKINEDIANGGAPSYAALRDWFENKEDPSIPKPKKFADVSYELNSKTVDLMKKAGILKGFVDYYERQIERIHLFQSNLDGSKRSELELQRLFELESAEMRDIILALITTSYTPKTTDGLAILISNRKLKSYFDHSAKTFLDKVFQRDLNAIEENIGSEEKNFSRILMKQNVKNGKPTSEFVLSLQKSCRELIDFVTAFQGRAKNKCEAGASEMSLGSSLNLDSGFARLSSANGKLASLFGGALSSGGPISVAANKGGAPSLSIFAGRDLTKGDPGVQGGSPSTAPNSGGNEINGTVNPTLNPTPINTPNVEPIAPQDSSGMIGNIGGNSFEAILKSIFDSNFQSLFNGGGLGLSLENQSLIANDFSLARDRRAPKPKFNCLDLDFRGIDLARCQRYFAIMPDLPVVNADAGTPTQTGGGFSLGEGNDYNFVLLSPKYASTVQDQGSEGACSAFAGVHTVIANLALKGIQANLSGAAAWQQITSTMGNLAGTQVGFNMLMQKNPVQGHRLVSAQKIPSSVSSYRQILNEGRAIYVGTEVSQDWYQPRGTLQCNGNYFGRHAYSIQGYDDAKQVFIVKNSWGEDWGEDGYHYLPYTCIGKFPINESYDLKY